MAKYNKLDYPIRKMEELSDEVKFLEYEYAKKFKYVCTVKGDTDKEKITTTKEVPEDMNKSCVYIMVINGKIFKIGTALRGIKGRIGSYNSGRIRYRNKGTNSGANYWILQSILNLKKAVKFYAFYPPTRRCKIFGETVDEPFPSSKTIEGVVIRKFETKYGKKPIGCIQG